MSPPARPHSPAARYLFMAVLGLLAGVVASVMVGRALQARRDPVPDSLMQVMAWQLRQLRQAGDGDLSCSQIPTAERLRTLQLLARQIGPAFPDLAVDRRFNEHAQALDERLSQALAEAPGDCRAIQALAARLDEDCEACHRQFR